MRRSRHWLVVAVAGLLLVPAVLAVRVQAAKATPVARLATLGAAPRPATGEIYLPRVRELSRLATPDLPIPGYLTPVTDPATGTRVTRVSDRTAMGVDLD